MPRGVVIGLAILAVFPVLMGVIAIARAEHFAAANRARRDAGRRYGATSAVAIRMIGLFTVLVFGLTSYTLLRG